MTGDVNVLTRTCFFLSQTPFDFLIVDDGLVTADATISTDGVVGSIASQTGFMAWHTGSVAVVFVFGTTWYTEFTVLDIHACRAIVGARSGTRIFTFRMTFTALF